MKKLITFFVFLYKWFISLFKREKKTTLIEKFEESQKEVQQRYSHPVTPPHNNRSSKRNKRGVRSRYTQYTPSGHPIFHTIIKNPN